MQSAQSTVYTDAECTDAEWFLRVEMHSAQNTVCTDAECTPINCHQIVSHYHNRRVATPINMRKMFIRGIKISLEKRPKSKEEEEF